MSLEKCCDNPQIRERGLDDDRRMRCLNCGHYVRVKGTYHNIATAWNESCVRELSCMEIISM